MLSTAQPRPEQVGILNVALTALAADIVITQEPVPEQPVDQPANVDPDAADAVSVTKVPEV